MTMRKKMVLATFFVSMCLFINLISNGVGNGYVDSISESDEFNYDDYVMVKSEDGRLMLLPKENFENIESEPFNEILTDSENESFIEDDESDEVGKFSSIKDFRSYVENHTQENRYWYGGAYSSSFVDGSVVELANFNMAEGLSTADTSKSTPSHSTTNVQVTGVDEGDIVKTDGEYAYIISKNRCNIFIVDVNPPEGAYIVSTIKTGGNIREIYVKDTTLVILGERNVYQIDPTPISNESFYYTVDSDGKIVKMDIGNYYYFNYINYQATFIDIFDISEKKAPELLDSHIIKGSLIQSRMIDDYLYVITSYYIYRNFNEYDLPVEASEIYFLKSTDDASYLRYYMPLKTILSIDITNPSDIVDAKVLLMDYTSNIYVSRSNIYITQYKYDYEKSIRKTGIHRILIENGMISYKAYGEIEGTLLNRFSMDEHNGYFRAAVSIGWRSSHRVYVLDMDLKEVGCLKDIAPNEQLYSARFMGDRAYLVTFVIRTGDPFFVINLSDPENPELLGELHIPGWSDYLHPYDENHVIGLGREAVLNGPMQGIKLSLFDVSDVKNPKEKSKVVIGDQFSSSIATTEPHAFLFSKEKNLLVIPINLNYTTNSAYVFKVTLDGGIQLKGTISHPKDDEKQLGYYWYYYMNSIKRSFYIGDTLYTLSDSYLKMNDLSDLGEINILELPDDSRSYGGSVICIYISPFIK